MGNYARPATKFGASGIWSIIVGSGSTMLICLCVIAYLFSCKPVSSQNWVQRTHLVSVSDDMSMSTSMRRIGRGGYELSGGERVSFSRWYSSKWKDTHFTWMTEVNQNVGFYWGFGTGERGEKYTVDPALRLGLVMQMQPSRNSVLSLSLIGLVGGKLSERTCTANYGSIGGTQTVNCRLAASALPPKETKKYMLDESPQERLRLHVRYFFRF